MKFKILNLLMIISCTMHSKTDSPNNKPKSAFIKEERKVLTDRVPSFFEKSSLKSIITESIIIEGKERIIEKLIYTHKPLINYFFPSLATKIRFNEINANTYDLDALKKISACYLKCKKMKSESTSPENVNQCLKEVEQLKKDYINTP